VYVRWLESVWLTDSQFVPLVLATLAVHDVLLVTAIVPDPPPFWMVIGLWLTCSVAVPLSVTGNVMGGFIPGPTMVTVPTSVPVVELAATQ
jgi:hypothetical protein